MNAIKLTKRELLRIAAKKIARTLEKEISALYEQAHKLRNQIADMKKEYAKQVAEKCAESSAVTLALKKALAPFGIDVNYYLDNGKIKLYVSHEFPAVESDLETQEAHKVQVSELETQLRELHTKAEILNHKENLMSYRGHGSSRKKNEDEFLLHLLDNLNEDTAKHLQALGETIMKQTENME